MEVIWKLADAKNRFSELVTRALDEEPQIVDRRGERVVIISAREYEKLTGTTPGFKELLMDGPSLEGVDIGRNKEPMRNIKL